MNSRRTSALSTKSCWLWRSSSWSWRAWRALMLGRRLAGTRLGCGLGRSSRLQVSRPAINDSSQLVERLVSSERSGSVRAACDQLDPGVGFQPGHQLACPFDLGLDRFELGRGQSPGAPPVPGGMTNSGPLAASTINVRGAIKLATSASPNCSSRPKTLRSTGCRQTSLRSSK